MLQPCPYKKLNQGQLECEIAKVREAKYTSSTSADACNDCPIPEIIQKVNCKNLIPLKLHSFTITSTFEGDPEEVIIGNSWEAKCQMIDFQNKYDYKKKCSDNCPAFQPIHLNLSTEESISIPKLNSETATDRDLRQAVLSILYQYHTIHPERYNCFDVTPEFLAKSLKINVKDVVRVVLPMEEEKEVEFKKYSGELYFRYVSITSKGIKMIDEKPLFGDLDTAALRSIKITNSKLKVNITKEGDIMSDSYNNDLREANIANFANQVQDNARQQANQHIHISEQKRTLTEAATEIQKLLKQLEQTNPTATEAEKVAYVNDETTPSFKRRVVGALQASGETAIDEFILENKYLKVAKAAIKGWLQPGS
jgi:DNA-binding MarR family transcriptional regulator